MLASLPMTEAAWSRRLLDGLMDSLPTAARRARHVELCATLLAETDASAIVEAALGAEH